MKNPNIKLPGNETFKHFILKQIGKFYLKNRQMCQYVVEEKGVPYIKEKELPLTSKEVKAHTFKDITDVLGVQRINNQYTIKSLEVKVSREDFKSGYCVGGEYNYLLVPKGLLKKEDPLPFFGILEIDLSTFNFDNSVSEVKTLKRAKKIDLPLYKYGKYQRNDNGEWNHNILPMEKQEFIDSFFRTAARKFTNSNLYKSNWLWNSMDFQKKYKKLIGNIE